MKQGYVKSEKFNNVLISNPALREAIKCKIIPPSTPTIETESGTSVVFKSNIAAKKKYGKSKCVGKSYEHDSL